MSPQHEEEVLWREYRSRLFGFVRRRVADDATTEDIVHDVLVRAYGKRDTLRSGTKFEQWLFSITRNAVIDHYRARRPTEPLPPDLAELTPQSERHALRELATCVQPLVATLPDHYRIALELSELHGLTQQETASRLGLTLSGAKSRVQRARRQLEQKLLDCCRIELDSRGAVVDYEQVGAPPKSADCAGC